MWSSCRLQCAHLDTLTGRCWMTPTWPRRVWEEGSRFFLGTFSVRQNQAVRLHIAWLLAFHAAKVLFLPESRYTISTHVLSALWSPKNENYLTTYNISLLVSEQQNSDLEWEGRLIFQCQKAFKKRTEI